MVHRTDKPPVPFLLRCQLKFSRNTWHIENRALGMDIAEKWEFKSEEILLKVKGIEDSTLTTRNVIRSGEKIDYFYLGGMTLLFTFDKSLVIFCLNGSGFTSNQYFVFCIVGPLEFVSSTVPVMITLLTNLRPEPHYSDTEKLGMQE